MTKQRKNLAERIIVELRQAIRAEKYMGGLSMRRAFAIIRRVCAEDAKAKETKRACEKDTER